VTGEVGILAFASYNGAGIRIRPNQKSAILPSKGINLNFWVKRTTQDTGPWVVLHNRLFSKAVVLLLSDPTRVLTERYTQNGGGTAVRTSTLWITTRLARNQTTHPTGFHNHFVLSLPLSRLSLSPSRCNGRFPPRHLGQERRNAPPPTFPPLAFGTLAIPPPSTSGLSHKYLVSQSLTAFFS